MENPVRTVEEPTPSSLPSLPKRIVQVFVSPGELFTALRDNPVWFGVLAVAVVMGGVAMSLIPADLWAEISRNQLIEQGREVPPGLESSAPIIKIFSVLGGSLAMFIMAFIMAGIVTLFFSFFFGDQGRYKQYLSVVSHAFIISALGGLLLVPLRIANGDPTTTLSLGTFATFLEEGYLFRVLKMLDLFAIWSYVVMAIGVTKIDPKRSFGFAVTFFMAFALAFALVFGSFGG